MHARVHMCRPKVRKVELWPEVSVLTSAFARVAQALPGEKETLAFHGTKAENIDKILAEGTVTLKFPVFERPQNRALP